MILLNSSMLFTHYYRSLIHGYERRIHSINVCIKKNTDNNNQL